MTPTSYRYTFEPQASIEEIEDTLVLSRVAIESLHGESQTRLDATYTFDAANRTCVIDADTPVGRDFNRLFAGFLAREFGPASFRVERLNTTIEPGPV